MSRSSPLTRPEQLYQAVEALPIGVTGEVINGQLHAHPRPGGVHGQASSSVGGDLFHPLSRGIGGPGGWWIIDEPEVHFIRDVELCVPDLAGWRRSRMPDLPEDQRFLVVPDWVCEVASPSTASYDREVKMPLYAQYGVAFAWLISPKSRRLEAFELEAGQWRDIGVFEGDQTFRVPPFEEVVLNPPWG